MNKQLAQRQAEERALESEIQYRSLFENMLGGVAYCKVLFDQEHPQDFVYLAVNDTFQTLTGLKNVVGKKASELIPGIRESCPKLFETYGRVALTGTHERFEFYLKPLDMWFDISVYSPKKEHIVAVFDVITARKRAEEQLQASLLEKEVLLKEVHHRVKNNLQIISSLLELQAASLHDSEARAAFKGSQSRVKTMALVHEQLCQSADLARIDFAAYAQTLTAHLLRSCNPAPLNIALQLMIKEAFLTLDMAVPCALIINELTANALKHAFPIASQTREKEIQIHLRHEEKRWVLVVQDNGIGLPPAMDANSSPGLGLQMVAIMTQQLHGTLNIERENGTRFTISIDTK